MTKKSLSTASLPEKQIEALRQLGERIRIARKRRGLTLSVLAERMLVSEKTLRRLEQGEPGVGLGVLASALFCLDLSGGLEGVAAMETDQLGTFLERQRLGRMRGVRTRKDRKLDF